AKQWAPDQPDAVAFLVEQDADGFRAREEFFALLSEHFGVNEPVEGMVLMRTRRGGRPDGALADGPGKLCAALGVTLAQNQLDLTRPPLWIEPDQSPADIVWTRRIGITAGADRYWRAVIKGSPFVSRSPLNREATAAPRPALA
ncbi:MAG: DNA-3-methyladenine glycosylase, partial [Gemmatimonadota bacterium]